jgi:stress-induced morphogen
VIEMAIQIPRGGSNAVIEQIKKTLHSFQEDHPGAQIDLYRQNPASIRVRIIDPGFAGMSKVERDERVWKYLDQLSDDDEGDISMLVLLTPEETTRSMANLEFEDPVTSRLWPDSVIPMSGRPWDPRSIADNTTCRGGKPCGDRPGPGSADRLGRSTAR